MTHTKLMLRMSVLAGCLFLVTACGEQPQEKQPPQTKAEPAAAPESVIEKTTIEKPVLETTTAESDDSLLKIKEAARKEKEMLVSKKDELQKLLEEKTDAPLTAQLGDAQKSSQQIASLKEQIQEHTDRYNQYIRQLQAGNVDTSEFIME